MIIEKEKLQDAINDIKRVKNTPYFQSEIYNSLKVAIDLMEDLRRKLDYKEEEIKYNIEIVGTKPISSSKGTDSK